MRHKLIDHFELHGVWSLDTGFEDYKMGKLNYNYLEGRNELEFSHSELKVGQKFDVIYGKTLHNQFISLFNVSVSQTAGYGVRYTKLNIEKMIIDSKWWFNSQEFKIDKVIFSFQGLEKYMHFNNWKKGTGNNDFIESKEELNEYQIDALNARLKEINRYKVVTRGFSENSYTLSNEPGFELTFHDKVDLDHAYKVINKLRQIMTFFIGEDLPIKFIEFPSIAIDFLGKETPYMGAYYLHQVIGNKNLNVKRSPYTHKDIENYFEEMLNKYFENYDKIKPIMQNHLGDLVMDNYSETQFLNACTNLEIFHREIIKVDKEISPELSKYYVEITAIASKYSEEIQSDIERVINDVKKINLNQRLRNLIKEIPESLLEKVLIKDYQRRMSDFIFFVSNTRNYITHGSTNIDNKIFKLDKLVYITKILRIFLEYHLLNYLGLPEKVIFSGIRHNNAYQNVMTNLYEFRELNE